MVEKGLIIKIDVTNEFLCESSPKITDIKLSKTMVIDNVDDLYGENSYGKWDNKLDHFLSENNVEYFNFTMEGYIVIKSDVYYNFNTSGDHCYYKIFLDGSSYGSSSKSPSGFKLENDLNSYSSYCTVFPYSIMTKFQYFKTGSRHVKITGWFSKYQQYYYSDEKYVSFYVDKNSTDFQFKFVNVNDDTGIEENLQFFQQSIQYDVLTHLSFSSDYYTVPAGIRTEIPFNFKRGKPDACVGLLDKEDIQFDLSKNMIIINTNEIGVNIYSIYCYTNTSTTNTVSIKIEVSNKFVKGMIGYYIKSDSFDTTCKTAYDISMQGIKIEIIRLEDEINQPYNPIQSIWDGLTPNFVTEYAVEWEGYLYIDETNKYKFKLESTHGSWLFVDYEKLLSLSGDSEMKKAVSTNYKSLEKGYHFIRVCYSKNIGSSGIIVSYGKFASDGQIDYHSLKGDLYFVPRHDIEYSTSYAVYIVDFEIPKNQPIIHEDFSSVTSCTSNPTLPPGLDFDESCTIKGKPTHSQDYKTYEITGKVIKNNDEEELVNTFIVISVMDFIKPQSIHFIATSNGERFENLDLYFANETHFLVKVETGFVLFYEAINLPSTFFLNKETGSFNVIAIEYYKDYQFEIRAYYSNTEYVSRNITVNVKNGCKENEKMHYTILTSETQRTYQTTTEFQYRNGTKITKFEFQPGNFPMYSNGTCLIPGEYTYWWLDGAFGGSAMRYFHYYVDLDLFDKSSFKSGNVGYYDFDSNGFPPIVNYSNIANVKEDYFLNEEVAIHPEIKIVLECEIIPELPSCLTFNKNNCSITGRTTEALPKTQFQIEAKNAFGSTITYLNLTLYDIAYSDWCKNMDKSFIRVYVFHPLYQYWEYTMYKTSEINDDIRTPLIRLTANEEKWDGNKEYEYDYCVNEDDYTIDFVGASNVYGGYFETYVNDIPIDRSANINNQHYQRINSITDYNLNTEWEYSVIYEEGWDSIDEASRNWKKSKLDDINNVIDSSTTNAIYIRKINTFENLFNYSAVALKVTYLSGMIVKLNSEELIKINLPLNEEIKQETKANNKYDELTDEVFILPVTMIEDREVIISIELHRHIDEQVFPQINVMMLKIVGGEEDCLILNKYTNKVNESTEGISTFPVQNGFDELPNTELYMAKPNVWAIIRYKQHYHAYFNQFSILLFALNFAIEDFSIEALDNNDNDDDDNWKLLAKFKDLTYDTKKKVFPNYNTTKMYSAIKMNFTKMNNNKFDIYDINFHLCALRYCEEINNLIPKTETGNEIEIKCDNAELSGNRKFYCSNKKEWIERSNTCEEPPSVLTKVTSYSFRIGTYYNELNLFTVSGKDKKFSMNPKIEGLEIDENSGLITGEPKLENSEEIVYTFTVVNALKPDGISFTIPLTVLPSKQPIEIWSNSSVTIEAGIELEIKLYQISGINLLYKVDKLPDGLILNENSGIVSGITFEIGTVNSYFTIYNDYGEINLNIEINMVLPTKPVNVKYEKELNLIFGLNYINLQPYQCIARIIKYSIDEDLPDGLKLDENSGLISGKVNAEPPSSKSYKIKCFNENGGIENPITINIEESVEPVIVSHVDSITIEGGKEYDEIILGRITGKNLLFSLVQSLPVDTLKFNSKKGTISGYIASEFKPMNMTVMISGGSGGGGEASFTFLLLSKINDEPAVIPSTKVSEVELEFGDSIKNLYLFVAVGTNLNITVIPDLPKRLTLDPNTGEIYGSINENVEAQNYTFYIRNYPSEKVETVVVMLGIKSIYCESNSGFPRTVADVGGREVLIECGGSKSGMKKRVCLLTDDKQGVWGKIDDSECKMSSGALSGIIVGSVCGGIIIIGIIVFCILRSGVMSRRVKSTKPKKSSNLHPINVPDKQVVGAVQI